MARTSIVISQQRKMHAFLTAKREGRKPVLGTRAYNRCALCGRRHGFIRFFGICRICFRLRAANGDVPGVTKSSW